MLAVAPDVFADDIFAMKGGTAINLFVRDMPRLSGDTKLIVENDAHQVKIEVNIVLRGSVLPVERRPLSARTSDLFDVWQLFESGDISDGMVECFVIYLTGHNRPTHEVLFGNDKDIAGEYSGPLSA